MKLRNALPLPIVTFIFLMLINATPTHANQTTQIASHAIRPSSHNASTNHTYGVPMVEVQITIESEAALLEIQELGYTCEAIGICYLTLSRVDLNILNSAEINYVVVDQFILVKSTDSPALITSAETYEYGFNGTDYNIPDYPGSDDCGSSSSSISICSAPSDARITRFNYRIQVNHTNVGDLIIGVFDDGLTNETIWDQYGSGDDGGFDDDPENDQDIYLDRWTEYFVGSTVNQSWHLITKDCKASNTGYIDYFELWIYYEESSGTPSPPVLKAISNSDGDGSYSISWFGSHCATGYKLFEQFNGGNWDNIYTGNDLTAYRTGRSIGEWCYYAVATNAWGDSSWSNIECTTVDTAPDPPSPPTLYPISNSDDDGSYSIGWSSSSGATSYTLYEQFNGGGWSSIFTGNGTTEDRTGRSEGGWCYYVIASNAGGDSGWSNIECTTVDTTPDSPPAPTLDPISNSDSDGSYSISWSSSSGATSYKLHEQFDGGGWSSIFTGNGTTVDRTGRSEGGWCYYVIASNAGGDSGWSNIECTTVDTTQDPPSVNSLYLSLLLKNYSDNP